MIQSSYSQHIVSAELTDIVLQIQHAKPFTDMKTKIIAIDGCGGAGKSTLAEKLSKKLGSCSIIHTDDFASWDQSQSWYPRMLEQVLEPLRKNQVAKFQKYDWNKRTLAEWVTIEPQEFVILEGVSSARKEFRPYLTFSIYVETDRELRLKRGLERDGLQAESQWLKWMKEEDEYLVRDNPKAYVNLIVSGAEGANEESDSLSSQVNISSPYSFKPMLESDLPLLFQWISEPHVKKWWGSDGSWEEFQIRYSNNIRSEETFPYIVSFQETPIGYINYWTTESDPDFKNLFPTGSVGTDQFIGVANMAGQGHGSKMVKAFTDWLLEKPEIPVVMTDPDIENTVAVRCYQEAGFQIAKKMESVEGSILLMERRKQLAEKDHGGNS